MISLRYHAVSITAVFLALALLGSAGATISGQLQLTDTFSDPARSDQLSELTARLQPAGMALPPAPDAGTLAGRLFGSLLLVNPGTGRPPATGAETAAALAGLGEGGFIRYDRPAQPAQLAVVLTGGVAGRAGRADRAGVVARFATALDRAGTGTVLAGRPGSTGDDGPIGVVRADAAATSVLSTVDDVSTAPGRVVTVLALAEQAYGGAGQYGTAGSAQAMVPAVRG